MDGIPQKDPIEVQTKKFKLPHPRIVILILITSVILLVLLGILIYNNLPRIPQALVSYQLRCGAKLDICNLTQLNAEDRVSLRIDTSAALAKYKDLKPDLCYYTNIQPNISEKLTPWYKVTVNNNSYFGGCIKNAYSLYQKRSQFAFFINGQMPNNAPIVKVLLTPSSTSSLETKLTKESIEIFNLK